MRKRLFPLVLSIALLASCGEDQQVNSLDAELNAAITIASEYVGKVHYILPTSNEFYNIPQDPQNLLTTDKVNLGQLLFHESAFSTASMFENMNGTYSCASCHHAQAGFQANTAQGLGDGGQGFGTAGESRKLVDNGDPDLVDVQPLRTPTAMNLAYQTNLLWNGQFGATAINEGTEQNWIEGTPLAINELGYEGLETQAIAGITVHRMEYNAEAVEANGYKAMFDEAFSNIPESDRYTVERAGQAMAAYERVVLSNQAPFQQWLRGDNTAMTDIQKEGAVIFFGKGNCTTCHDGPALAKMEFHAIGMEDFESSEVFKFDPADPATAGRASFTKEDKDMFKFKVPQLYNLKDSPFYGHGASLNSIREVVEYKNMASAENQDMNSSYLSEHFVPLNLDETEVDALVDFLENALYDPNLDRYVPQSLPTGNCFPNNDEQSKEELGCS